MCCCNCHKPVDREVRIVVDARGQTPEAVRALETSMIPKLRRMLRGE